MVNIIWSKVFQCHCFSQLTLHTLSQDDVNHGEPNHGEPEQASHQQQ